MAEKTVVADVRDNQDLFPISTVSDATGVAPVTLRAWERRYNFLHPHRTPKGHRLYSVEHIALIRRVLSLLDAGIPVSRVGDVLKAESLEGSAQPTGQNNWDRRRKEMLEAIAAFDELRLDSLYNDALADHPISVVTEKLVIPLLHSTGENWEKGITGVAEEHFFSLYIRNKLGSRWHHGRPAVGGQRLVGACMPGELHEFGLLFLALVARARGLDMILLGANTPLAELPKVVASTRARGVVLSCTIEPGWQVVEHDLRSLVRKSSVPVFVGGRGVPEKSVAIEATGARTVGAELVEGVETIYQELAEDRKNDSYA